MNAQFAGPAGQIEPQGRNVSDAFPRRHGTGVRTAAGRTAETKSGAGEAPLVFAPWSPAMEQPKS